ncbi:MAG TPA: fibronectin type III domain-containing protein, partial [Bacillota bacterium]|nr:fibronectin type III domain-containing protein [Bacillota bacterium]
SYVDGNVSVQQYSYWVTGVNSYGEGLSSDIKKVTPYPALMAPAAPSGLSMVAESGSVIRLSWTDNSTNETGFTIERMPLNGEWETVATVSFNQTIYRDGGLRPNTGYSYRIKASNIAGDSEYNQSGPVYTLNYPVAPTNLKWNIISSSRISLSWTDSPNETAYRIEVLNNKGDVLRTLEVAANTETYTITGLTANTKYRFRIWVVNGTGWENAAKVETETIMTPVMPKPGI